MTESQKMQYQILLDRMEGSFLKQEYLEAFLMQSAYIESLLHTLLGLETFQVVWADTHDSKKKMRSHMITEEYEKKTLYETIEILNKFGVIDKDIKKELHEYRDLRNKTMHGLISQISNEDFEKNLKEAYLAGKKLIQGELKTIAGAVAKLQDSLENNKALVQGQN